MLRLFLFLTNLFALSLAQAHFDNTEYPIKILQEHRKKILLLSSDQEAIEFHQSFMKKFNPSRHPSTSRKPSITHNPTHHLSQEKQETIATFWAAMAAIGYIQKLAVSPKSESDNQRFIDNLPTKTQLDWIQSKPTLEKIKHLLDIQKTFSLTPQQEIIALPLGVEAQAYETAWEAWQRIRHWQQQQQTSNAKLRLCGTWKWIIHNHQNHGDHKTTMTFLPPGLTTPSHVEPTTILIYGDVVYLKWTFPQGIQEDSLLISNHDSRLEGTFTNSLGPYGSISGQRLSPCPK